MLGIQIESGSLFLWSLHARLSSRSCIFSPILCRYMFSGIWLVCSWTIRLHWGWVSDAWIFWNLLRGKSGLMLLNLAFQGERFHFSFHSSFNWFINWAFMGPELDGSGDRRKGGISTFEDETPAAAFLASLSACSLPRTLLWAVIHLSLIFSGFLVGTACSISDLAWLMNCSTRW